MSAALALITESDTRRIKMAVSFDSIKSNDMLSGKSDQ